MIIKNNEADFSIDDLLKIHLETKLFLQGEDSLLLNESGLETINGSWTRYKIIDKQKLMLFVVKYGISNQ
jgi:hypothetical protein